MTFCKDLPKIELHAHLNGSISIETLQELRDYNIQNGEPQIDDETWLKLKQLSLSDITSLSECFQVFDMAYSVTVNPKCVQIATERVIKDFASDNVVYLELRSTLRQEPNMTKTEYIEAMISGIKNSQKDHGIIVKLIVSLNRKNSLEEAEENVDLAIKYSKLEPDIVVGVDLSGDPSKKTFPDFVRVLDKAREEGLKLTIHFAEIPGDQEIYDILKYQPDRLGHGTFVFKSDGSKDNWNLLLKSRIPIETCITSNIKCKTVASVEEHHFKHLYQINHPVVVCTDDKSIFQTCLSSEFEVIKSTFQLSEEDLWKLSYSAIDYIFSGNSVKSHLRKILLSWKEI